MGCPELPLDYYFRVEPEEEKPLVCPFPTAGKIPLHRVSPVVAHDPMGNRQSYDDNGTPYSYQSNNLNQYETIFNPDGSAITPTHDLNGNVLSCGHPCP